MLASGSVIEQNIPAQHFTGIAQVWNKKNSTLAKSILESRKCYEQKNKIQVQQ